MNSLIDPNQPTDPVLDDNKDYLKDLVGDGKKFKSPEELAKGKFIADEYIKTLEKGRDELRQDYLQLKSDYESRAKLEEVIDQLSKPQQPTEPSNPPLASNVQQPTFDAKQVETLVSKKLMEHEVAKKQTENFNLVKSKLQERFGTNYQATLTKQIQELGLTPEFVDSLAHNHPQVLFRTLGIDQPQTTDSFQAPVRSSGFRPQGEKKRTEAYYEQLRKENPTTYHDQKTTVQRHNDAIALGEAFFDVSNR